MKKVFLFLFILTLYACSPIKKATFKQHFENEEAKFQQHTGFVLYDLDKQAYLFQHNADKYFTPASNTKIFTFWGALNIIGDSISAIEYTISEDSLIFWGTGDPSFLNSKTATNTKALDFLSNPNYNLYWSTNNYQNEHFGPGWAWDDYTYGFSAERSPFPIYGNIFEVSKTDGSSSIKVNVPFFKQFAHLGDSLSKKRTVLRNLSDNEFYYYPNKNEFEYEVPFQYSSQFIRELLADTLKKTVTVVNNKKPKNTSTLYSVPTDSIYKVMMQESDNFLAEQLLLVSANIVSDTLNSEIGIDYITENYLTGIPDKPLWRDGSGLSRYNLFTPRSIVWLWLNIYAKVDQDRLFSIIATGGKNGTLENYFGADAPYIFGKTGTLSNNFALSGFLVAKSGKVLVFSYMNNNYPVTSREIKPGMEKLLLTIYNKY